MGFKSLIVKLFSFLFILCIFIKPEQALAQENEESLTNELLSAIKSDPINLTVLMRNTGRFSYRDDQFNGGRTFALDNLDIMISGKLDGNFDYRANLNLAGSPNFVDAFIGYKVSEKLNIRAGVQQAIISAEQVPNPGATDFIDRARLVQTQLNPREIGIGVFGQLDELEYSVGVYNGTGRNPNTDNQYYLTSRLSYNFNFNDYQNLVISLNGAFGKCHTINCSPALPMEESHGDSQKVIYGADFRYESNLWMFASEILSTTIETSNYLSDEETILGYHITGGIKPGPETILLARWDHLEYRDFGLGDDLLLLGLNHQMTQFVRLQLNLLALINKDTENQLGLSANFQLLF